MKNINYSLKNLYNIKWYFQISSFGNGNKSFRKVLELNCRREMVESFIFYAGNRGIGDWNA